MLTSLILPFEKPTAGGALNRNRALQSIRKPVAPTGTGGSGKPRVENGARWAATQEDPR